MLVVGLVLWVAVLKSGVHATLAGVIVGFMIPISGVMPRRSNTWSMRCPWSTYLILPLFAFANARVSLDGIQLSGSAQPVPWASCWGSSSANPSASSPSAGCR